jgi:hypothetical protein
MKARELVIDYKRTFDTPHGKRVLFDLMNVGHILGSTFAKGDPHLSAYKEGQRAIVRRILTKLHIKEKDLNQMFKGENE